MGETEQRLYPLSAWRETTLLYQPRTRGPRMDRSANAYHGRPRTGLVNLLLAIITINGWNRLAIGFRKIPGEYQPHKIA
jgi:hypothetical protein